jgi:hypothetical protein
LILGCDFQRNLFIEIVRFIIKTILFSPPLSLSQERKFQIKYSAIQKVKKKFKYKENRIKMLLFLFLSLFSFFFSSAEMKII